ncbi:MAG TPA: hypothetical protein VFZ01_17320 [Geminicoccaceae bacterium]
MRGFRPGQPIARRAFVCMFDVESNGVFEAEVDLEAGSVAAWREVPGARPTIMPEELSAVEACVKADPAFAEACARRGIAVEQAQVDAWSAGNY